LNWTGLPRKIGETVHQTVQRHSGRETQRELKKDWKESQSLLEKIAKLVEPGEISMDYVTFPRREKSSDAKQRGTRLEIIRNIICGSKKEES